MRDAEDLHALVHQLSATVEHLERRVAELQAGHTGPASTGAGEPPADTSGDPGHEVGRRAVLVGLGAAAAGIGAAASGLLTPPPASATTGTMQYGANNNAGSSYTNLSSSNTTDTLDVFNSAATPVDAYARQPAGLYAQSNQVGVDGRGDRWGVHGTGDLAGVWAEGNIAATGVALRAEGGRAQLLLVPLGTAGPPSSGSHLRGELLVDVAGTMWLCVSGGTPGTWRELAGIPTTGAFHAITPVRVYDSRCPAPQPGTLSGGAWRIISVAHGRNLDTGVVTASNVVPSGAQAVTYNLTIVSQTGTGWLSVNPGSAATYGSSSVNWWAPGQILANGLVVKLDTNRQVKVFAGGGSTHFLIDVTGYYL